MKLSSEEPAKYLVAKILEALAQDQRTNVLDVQVKVVSQRVFLFGTLDSEERRRAVEEVAEEIVPADMVLMNNINVADYAQGPDEEVVS